MGATSSFTYRWDGDPSGAVAAMARLSAEEKSLQKAVRDTAKELNESKKALEGASVATKAMTDKVVEEEKALREAAKALTAWRAEHQKELNAATGAWKKFGEDAKQNLNEGSRAAQRFGGMMQQAAYGIDDAVQALGMGQGLSGALRGAGNNITAVAAGFGALPTVIAAVGVAGATYFARIADRAKESNEELEKQKKLLEEITAEADKASLGVEEVERRGRSREGRGTAAAARQRASEMEERVYNMRLRGNNPLAAQTNAEQQGDIAGFRTLWRGAGDLARFAGSGMGFNIDSPERVRQQIEADLIRARAERDEADRRVAGRETNIEGRRAFTPLRPGLEHAARRMLEGGAQPGAVEHSLMGPIGQQFPQLREAMQGLVHDMVQELRRAVDAERANPAIVAADPVTGAGAALRGRVRAAQDFNDAIEEQNRLAQRDRGGRPLRASERRDQERAGGLVQEQQDLLRRFERIERRIQEGDQHAREDMRRLIEEIRRLPGIQTVIGSANMPRVRGAAPGGAVAPGGAPAPGQGAFDRIRQNPPQPNFMEQAGAGVPVRIRRDAAGNEVVQDAPDDREQVNLPGGGRIRIGRPAGGGFGGGGGAVARAAAGPAGAGRGRRRGPPTAAQRQAANRAAFVADKAAKRARFLNGRRDPNDIEADARARRLAFRQSQEARGPIGDDPEGQAMGLRGRIRRNQARLQDMQVTDAVGDGSPQNTVDMKHTERELARQTTLLEKIEQHLGNNPAAQADVRADRPAPQRVDRNGAGARP